MELLPISTERLELRRFSVDDLTAFQSYRRDPTLAEYQDWEPTTDDQAHAFLSQQSGQPLAYPGQWLQVAITRRDNGHLLGDIGLCITEIRPGTVEVGFTLARDAQGHGFASEAVGGVLSRLLGSGMADSVIAITDARNAPAIALLKRLGFGRTQTIDTYIRGAPCQEHEFELTVEQWKALRAG